MVPRLPEEGTFEMIGRFLARLEREAKLPAAINYTNIAPRR